MTELPPPGWYDDPTDTTQERWWSGEAWSEQVRRKPPTTPTFRASGLRAVGDFIGHAFNLIRQRWDDMLLVAVLAGGLLAVAAVALLRPVIDAIDFIGNDVIGWDGVATGRVVAFGLIALTIGLVSSMALYRLMWESATDQPSNWGLALQYGVTRALPLLGWMAVALLPVVAAMVLFIFIAIGIGPFGVFLVIALFAGIIYWIYVINFVPVALAMDEAAPNPIASALSIIKGRWWKVFGRMLLFSLIAGIIVNVLGAIVTRVAGNSVLGVTIVGSGDDFRFAKSVGGVIDYFVGAFLLFTYVTAANVPQLAAATSIAYDVRVASADGD